MTGWKRNQVAIVGAGYSTLERRSSRTLADLTLEACRNAIADSGLTLADINGVGTVPTMPAYGNAGSLDGIDIISVGLLLRMLGIGEQVRWYCQTPGLIPTTVIDVSNAIAAGACDVALIWRAVHMPQGRYSNFSRPYATGDDQFRAPYGWNQPAAWQAMAYTKYFADHGAGRADMGRFVVANREKAAKNPRSAFFGKPLTLDGYLTSRMISEPLCIYDCDLPVDGCAAIVLARADLAHDLAKPAAYITGIAQTTAPSTGGFTDPENMWAGGTTMAKKLWASAGLGPEDMDIAEVYDGFSIFVWMWLESLGFCKRGEAAQFAGGGAGKLAINSLGASLGEGRLHGMAHITSAFFQLTGRAGANQVPGAKHAVVTVGPGSWVSGGLVLSSEL
ncbi:MAG: thiolase C-terminal domain-containing protein [Dehalococcoidia bacterium]